MARPLVVVSLLLAVIHLVTAGTKFDGERGELRKLSSTIEDLKLTFGRALRDNGGKNKSHKRTKKSGHRKKSNKSRNRKKKSGQRKKKFGKRKNNIGKHKNKSVPHKRKAGRKMWGKMAKGNGRQTCDVQALCQKIKDFIKISNQLRKVKRITKACALMENKAKKSNTEFEATVTSLTSVLLVTRTPFPLEKLSRSNASTVQDVTIIRDQLKNCTDTVKTKCDKTEVEACQNETLLTTCEEELKIWLNKFGPAKGSCLQSSDDCCSCINAIPDVSEQCLVFDEMSTIVVRKKTKCTNGNEEGSFGYCRKLQQEAAVKGPTVAKVYCQSPANLTLNVTALEASVLSILDAMGNITSKLDATTADLDATKAKVDANTGKVDATATKVDANTVKVDAATVKVDANTVKVDANTVKVDANTVKVDANTVKVGNIETCFSDKSSSACPASATGKTGIKAAITDLEEGPMFSCTYQGDEIGPTGNGGTLTCPSAGDAACILTYTKCDVNQGVTTGVTTDASVDISTGKFTVPKAGRYRLTFMALAKSGTNKKAIISLTNKKKSDSSIVSEARALVQNKLKDSNAADSGNFYATISLDVIRDLAKDDEIYINFNIGDGTLVGKVDPIAPSIIFTGQLVSLIP